MDPVEKPERRSVLTVDEILTLYGAALIGFKEARSLLAKGYPAFKAVRDPDLDTEIEKEPDA